MSKYNNVGNHMPKLILIFCSVVPYQAKKKSTRPAVDAYNIIQPPEDYSFCRIEKILGKSQIQINKNFQYKIVNIFLSIIFSIFFGCSKEPSH